MANKTMTMMVLGIVGERGGQDLQGDITTEPGVFRALDFAHSSSADEVEDLIRSKA